MLGSDCLCCNRIGVTAPDVYQTLESCSAVLRRCLSLSALLGSEVFFSYFYNVQDYGEVVLVALPLYSMRPGAGFLCRCYTDSITVSSLRYGVLAALSI